MIHGKYVKNHGDVDNQQGGEILDNSFDVKKYCWKPCSCCKETVVVFILRTDYRGINYKKMYSYILRIAQPEHLMTL